MTATEAPETHEPAGGPPNDNHPDLTDDTALDEPGGGWLAWVQLVVIVAAAAFFGGAVVYFVDSRQSEGGPVDVGFYQDMTTHHDQAVYLAQLELGRGENSAASTFAEEILIFQNRELGIMATRLDDWGESPANRPDTAMAWMGMETAPAEMPGMATQAQIDELAAAHGAAADALFLELMAEHHRGGLHMASYATEHAETADVRALAARMARNQAIDINEMALTAEGLGFDIDIERVDVPPEPN